MDPEHSVTQGFRETEVAQVFDKIRAGESVSVIGIGNIGKSNLIQRILDPQVHSVRLGDEADRTFFLRVNFHNLPDFSNRSVYSLMLEQMEMFDLSTRSSDRLKSVIQEVGTYHEELLSSENDELKIQRFFKLAVRAFMGEPGCRLVLVMDQFDQLYQHAGERLFFNLRALRDMYKYRISYLVFTNSPLSEIAVKLPGSDGQMLHRVGGDPQEDAVIPRSRFHAREEFAELVQANHLYLKPYSRQDSELLLRNVARRKGLPFQAELMEPVYQVSGGHAGLLRMCYLYAVENELQERFSTIPMEDLLKIDSISRECERIWFSLSEDEQVAISAHIRQIETEYVNPASIIRINQKGLVRPDRSVFSPLFEKYVRQYSSRLDKPVYVDKKSHIVYVNGFTCEALTNTEYRFFLALYERENEVVEPENLYTAVYPDESEASLRGPQTLATIASRIRGKLVKLEENDLLLAIHKGYMLNNKMNQRG